MKWIYDTVTRRNPLQYKFEFALWTRRMIQVLVRKRLGVKLSLASIGRLLAQMGLTCQKPLARAFEQNPALVGKWLREEYPAIRSIGPRGSSGWWSLWGKDRAFLPATLFAGTEPGRTRVERSQEQRHRTHEH